MLIIIIIIYSQILGGMLGSAMLKDGNPLSLHFVMFIPTIMGQGTTEQQAEWITRAWFCNIIGTYAQVNTKKRGIKYHCEKQIILSDNNRGIIS